MTRKRHKTKHPNIFYRLVDESNPDSQRRYGVRYYDGNGGEHTKMLPLGSNLEDAKTLQAKLNTRNEKPKSDQKQMRCLSGDELSRLLSMTSEPRWKALFATLAYCGLRISEALELTWDDIQEDHIKIRKSKTKAGIREVPLPTAVKRLLTSWRLQQAPGIGYVFSTRENGPCGASTAFVALQNRCDRAAIPRYTLHELRHTYASILISRGVDLPTIAEQMGHANPAITLKTYAHLYNREEGRKKVLAALDDAMGGVL